MIDLQRKIKQLERNMNAEKTFFYQNGVLLKQQVATPQFLVGTVVGVGVLSLWVYHHMNKPAKPAENSSNPANHSDFLQLFFQYLAPAMRFIFPLLLA